MSEFSSSCHIRTTDAAATERLLEEKKYSGLVFGPTNGWLTFVPFADSSAGDAAFEPAGLSPELSKVTGSLVLQYLYAEDHMWAFSVARPGHPISVFMASWDPKPEVMRNEFDIAVFESIAAADHVEPLLTAEPSTANSFAELLGLPAHQWLSHQYIQDDPDLFISDLGARQLGETRPSPEKRLELPDATRIEVTKDDFTAREALAMLTHLTDWMQPTWTLYEIHGHAHGGGAQNDWQFRYFNNETRDNVQAYLFANGNAGFQHLGQQSHDAPLMLEPFDKDQVIAELAQIPEMQAQVREMIQDLERSNRLTEPRHMFPPLPTDWLDSRVIAEASMAIESPPEMPEAQISLLSLSWGGWPRARWTVHYVDPNGGGSGWHLTAEFDALTAQLLYEKLGRSPEGDYMVRTVRERIGGSEWRDA